MLREGDSRICRIGEDAESVGIIRTTAFNFEKSVRVLPAGLSTLLTKLFEVGRRHHAWASESTWSAEDPLFLNRNKRPH